MMFAVLEISSFIIPQKVTATTLTATLSLIICLLCFSSAQPAEQCSGLIGSNATERASTPSRAQLFYLNVANPAPCTGSITSWRVCYYGPDDIPSNSLVNYWATYAVYRRTGTGSNVRYIRVSDIFRAARTNLYPLSFPEIDGEILEGGFHCYTDSLDEEDSPLAIHAGDILGACVFDPDGDIVILDADVKITLPLDVVGKASGESLLRMSMAGCSRFDLPSDIPANRLTPLNSRRLHIYANIVPLAQTLTSVTTTTDQEINTIGNHTTNPALQSQMTNSLNIAIAKPTPITTHHSTTIDTKESQEGRSIVAIAGVIAGPTAGGLLILLLLVAITVTVIYIISKWKISPANDENSSKNASVDKSKADDNIITNINPAYKSVRRPRVTANHDFEEIRDTSAAGVGDITTDTELQQAYKNQDPELKMEKNVAYQPSTIVQTPLALHLSMEYWDESRKAFNVNHQATSNDKDYI